MIDKQKLFLANVSEKTKILLDKHGEDQAMRFVKRNAPLIFRLHEDAFDAKFKKIGNFIDHIGDDYTEEENFNILFKGKYKEEDIENFAKKFLSLISEN
ncbi:MAG: hypothetical protein PHR61_00265 [Candidatus Absconditabacteria bacterium]|nr:hypothetical protein [Candidatus Absconditabacteria bacterium]